MRSYLIVFGFFAVPALLIGALVWVAKAPERAGYQMCDEAIMATLKAPATYRRIDGPDTFATGDDMFRITYDAQNSFGVPLRSKGFCTITDDGKSADWVQLPDTE